MTLTDQMRSDILRVAPRIQALVYATYGARQFPTCTPEDVYQAAMEAVCEARPRYNPSLGASWPTYAGNRARGAIFDFVRDQCPGSRRYPARQPLSLDVTALDSDVPWVARLSYDDPDPPDERFEQQLRALIGGLKGRKAQAFSLYAEMGMSLAEVAVVLGVTDSRVSQCVREARTVLAPQVERLLEPVAA